MDLTTQHRTNSQTFPHQKRKEKRKLDDNRMLIQIWPIMSILLSWRLHGQVYKFQDQSNYPKPFELQTNFWRHGNKWEKNLTDLGMIYCKLF